MKEFWIDQSGFESAKISDIASRMMSTTTVGAVKSGA
jgi:hypothetical protein